MINSFLGIDIGGTNCKVSLGNDQGKIIDKISFPTLERQGPQQAIDNFLKFSDEVLARHGITPSAIGISCGSPLDPDRGVIQSPPNLPSWNNVEIVRIFERRYGLPTFLDNDANAGALAEFSFGAGRGYRNIVFITFGTGCGAGLILDGRIYRGTNCYAGEVGHIRLEKEGPVGYHKSGSFEGFCSGGGLQQLGSLRRRDFAGATVLGPNPTAEEIGKAAVAGDELAVSILEECGHYLGRGLAYIVDILNPQRIIIGSVFVRCEKFLRPSMESALREEALAQSCSVCEVVPAGLGEMVGDFAALSVGYYGYFSGAVGGRLL